MDSQSALFVAEHPEHRPQVSPRVFPFAPPQRALPAQEVWARVCEGTLVIDAQRADDTHTLLALREQVPTAPAIAGRRLRVLDLLLRGFSQNYAALEVGVAPSTISAELKRALLTLGLEPRLSAIPVYLSQLSQAARSGATLRLRDGRFESREPGYQTLFLPRHDQWLAERLSPGELQVCSLLLDGRTHQQIARSRGTAVRTVANQLGSVFAKLRVSGRMEVVAMLASATVTVRSLTACLESPSTAPGPWPATAPTP